ncbi:MAG: hypothetical protein D8B41_03370 [Porphyromonas sp.]|nr:MAG: hypothetical protein D8B41_03370 [Porphyromonas sp.]
MRDVHGLSAPKREYKNHHINFMDKTNQLKSIAEFLNLNNVIAELTQIETRAQQQNAPIILPLVGEFSSGKTTLINALTDSKCLESATKPTTATIYEVHFGAEVCRAEVINAEGARVDVSDLSTLKNDALADAQVVTLFDTSNRVPSSTIIVDTPGLSSPDPKHRQTLVDFLPKADGILLVADINQQITRSLTDFIQMIKLSQRPIYLILTKSDTKSREDVELAKAYICKNCEIPLKQVAVVSATKDSLTDFYALLDSIQQEKKDILKRVDEQRIKNIIQFMSEYIDGLISASDSSDGALEDAIMDSQEELNQIKQSINRLIQSMADDIEEQERETTRKFEDTVFDKLNTLISGKSSDFDNDAIMAINGTASLLMSSYRNNIQTAMRSAAQKQKGSEHDISFSSLMSMDLSNVQMSGLSYTLDLNSMGHEYDKWIKMGVIATAAVVRHSVFEGAEEAKQLLTFAKDVVSTYKVIEDGAQRLSAKTGSNKDIIDNMVGLVTENLFSKPQRVRAIHNYIDTTLSPEFRERLCNISHQLIEAIRESLYADASEVIGQRTETLNQMKTERKEQIEQFNQRINQLRDYKKRLLTL